MASQKKGGWLLVGVQAQGERRAWVGDYDTLPQFISMTRRQTNEAVVMDVSGLVQYNSSEGGRLPSYKDTGIGVDVTREGNGGIKCVLEKQASQQSAKKRIRLQWKGPPLEYKVQLTMKYFVYK